LSGGVHPLAEQSDHTLPMVTDSGDESTSVDDNTTVTSDSECASASESISSSVNTVNTPVHIDNEVELHHLLKLAQSSSVNTVNQCFTSNVNTCSQSGITVTAHHLKAADCMGSSLRPSSSHGLPVVWAVQTRSKSTASQSPTFSHNEGASSSSSKPQHIHFDDSDSDTEEHNMNVLHLVSTLVATPEDLRSLGILSLRRDTVGSQLKTSRYHVCNFMPLQVHTLRISTSFELQQKCLAGRGMS